MQEITTQKDPQKLREEGENPLVQSHIAKGRQYIVGPRRLGQLHIEHTMCKDLKICQFRRFVIFDMLYRHR